MEDHPVKKQTEMESDMNKLLLDDDINNIFESTLESEVENFAEIPERQVEEQSIDSKIEITISQDEMLVTADLFPPLGSGKVLTAFDVFEQLHGLSITENAICKKKVHKYINEIEKERKVYREITIARGTQPTPHIPSYTQIIYDFKNCQSVSPEKTEHENKAQVDHKKFSSICIIRKGTLVARKYDPIEGKNGKSVTGEVIPFQTAKIKDIKLGKNIELLENNDIVTTKDGEIVFNKNELSLNNILNLNQGVSYKTGHIKFPGTIIIKGEVEDDFNIIAENNIYVHNALAASNIYCGGNLIVENGGIIGRKHNKIKVVGSVKSLYVENVIIEALQNIFIEKSAFGSTLSSNDTITFGEKSKLIGGKVYAKNGINCHDIGNESGAITEIYCGDDFAIIHKLFLIRKHREKQVIEKQKILKRDPSSKTDDIDLIILKCDMSSDKILQMMKYNEEAKVHIIGKAFPGTVIDICHIKHTVSDAVSNGFFYLNKEDGAIHFQNHI
ncbi:MULTISPECIES: DUF342 domain-containing protein [unclassified Oceanispirochaeta]|uniref:DUF342 domain-containing protein n=1 Tax=unclassified Oceanispirochaeta TaxID=2635722 RepID=UPI000E09A4E5|nr:MULTISPECIES: FapA family protein [unclassified Oceanispirochaeta]MBF9014022.1 DUF342 domain-containing protein [Oceanispirochaeta sp. M2]NPD70513.1 DUF342 domain-containing protein [Oceanispirochaeta sp. M1]RDG34282.1 DUF342 domain-containing protein [Oceanispirochaeta sp. M1]